MTSAVSVRLSHTAGQKSAMKLPGLPLTSIGLKSIINDDICSLLLRTWTQGLHVYLHATFSRRALFLGLCLGHYFFLEELSSSEHIIAT